MICAQCLQQQLTQRAPSRVSSNVFVRALQLVAGFLIAWVAFYFLGQVLLETPSNLHEGTLWQEDGFWSQ